MVRCPSGTQKAVTSNKPLCPGVGKQRELHGPAGQPEAAPATFHPSPYRSTWTGLPFPSVLEESAEVIREQKEI